MRYIVFWYVLHVKLNRASQLVRFFNKQEAIDAFIPKEERWFNKKGVKDYVVKDVYPEYVFVKSELNRAEFDHKFKDFFASVAGFVDVLEKEDVYPLSNQEQFLLEKLFGNGEVIKHSVGDSIHGKYVAKSGSLVGLEDWIVKVDRHKHLATLQCDGFIERFKVAAEVVEKR